MGDSLRREALPIPNRPTPGPVTYDAKDPGAAFPPIEQLRPPEGAPNVRVRIDLGDDAGEADHLITAEDRMRIATTRQ